MNLKDIISLAKGFKTKTIGQEEFEKMMDKGVPSSFLMDNWDKIKKALEKEGFTVKASRKITAQLIIVKDILDTQVSNIDESEDKGNSLYAFSDHLEFFFNPCGCTVEILKDGKSYKGKVVMGENDINGIKVFMKKYSSDIMFSFEINGKEKQFILQLRIK